MIGGGVPDVSSTVYHLAERMAVLEIQMRWLIGILIALALPVYGQILTRAFNSWSSKNPANGNNSNGGRS